MLKKKIRLTPTTAGILIAFYTTMTPILAKPKPNTEGIKNEAKPWLDSARDIGLWLIPLTGLVACIVHTVTWMTKAEEDHWLYHWRRDVDSPMETVELVRSDKHGSSDRWCPLGLVDTR